MRRRQLIAALVLVALTGCAGPTSSDQPPTSPGEEAAASATSEPERTQDAAPAPEPEPAPTVDPDTVATSPLGTLTYVDEADDAPTAVPPLPEPAPAPGSAHITLSRTWNGELAATAPGTVVCEFGADGMGDPQVSVHLASDPNDGHLLAPGHLRMDIVALTETSPEDWPHIHVSWDMRTDADEPWTGFGDHEGGNGDFPSAEASWDGSTLRFAVAAVNGHEFSLEEGLGGWTHVTGAVTC